MHKKTKGSIAEMNIASRLMAMGYSVLFPYGENCRYDLVAEKDGKFIRIQVKYVTPKNGILEINCKSSNNWSVERYTERDIDILAVYDPVNNKAYFIKASQLNSSIMKLRLEPAKNNQKLNIRNASDYLLFPTMQ